MSIPETCRRGEHRCVTGIRPITIERGPSGPGERSISYFLRQGGTCDDCDADVYRVTELIRFNPWRAVRGVARGRT